MAISYVNTTEVESIAKDLISLSNEFNTEINNLFSRFSEVPSVTKEWVGNKAIFYFGKVSLDKRQYNNFATKLRDIGYKLSTDVYEIQTVMNKNNNEEAQRGD